MRVVVPIGTRKGLFLLESDQVRGRWTLAGPLLEGWSVYHAILDPRDGVLHACTNHEVYGATAHRSADLGKSWQRAEELGLPDESGLTLERTWHGVMLGTEARGASNSRAKRELGWTLRYASWRQGFVAVYATEAASTAEPRSPVPTNPARPQSAPR